MSHGDVFLVAILKLSFSIDRVFFAPQLGVGIIQLGGKATAAGLGMQPPSPPSYLHETMARLLKQGGDGWLSTDVGICVGEVR